MKTSRKILLGLLLAALLTASFLGGTHLAERQNSREKAERCGNLILFAIDKAENGDLAEDGTMEALISNVYAAWQFCEEPKTAEQLHGLWNYLIFESGDDPDAAKEIVLIELNDALRAVRTAD